jgi:N-acetyltransferase
MRLTPVAAGNGHVLLEPLVEGHRESLRHAAADPTLWTWWPRIMSDWDAAFDWQLALQASGDWILHAVKTPSGAIVGQTCFLSIAPEHARVEVGGTWYTAPAQGSAVNPAAKLLMLGHAFACGAERVELKTDSMNTRSRRAMEKLGATFEGVHRRHMRRTDGSWRDTAWYSIIRDEWPLVESRLRNRLAGE